MTDIDRLDHDLRDLRGEMRGLRSDFQGEITLLRAEMNDQFRELHLLLLRGGGALVIALIGLLAAIIFRGA